MKETEFLARNYSNNIVEGLVSWASPSNIALVKYWGKKENQIPENQSISFTLNTCKTETKLSFVKKEKEDHLFSFDVFFENKKNSKTVPQTKFMLRTAKTI